MAKLYLVWNEAKTECVGFASYHSAYYACTGDYAEGQNFMESLVLADKWLDIYGHEKCTITEIEV